MKWRMLPHAWNIPATINGQPYIDASYLCAIPVVAEQKFTFSCLTMIPAPWEPILPMRDWSGSKCISILEKAKSKYLTAKHRKLVHTQDKNRGRNRQ